MKRYHLSDTAARDLDEIFNYWAERCGLDVADRIIDAITERFWILAQYPAAGRYLIHYRKVRRGIEIVHIFHGARNQKRALGKS